MAIGVAIILCALALLHVYWGIVGVSGRSIALPEIDGKPTFMPSRLASFAVASALAVAALRGRLRVLLSSGQAVVVHRLAVMSKDGDWIVREDAVSHVLAVLSRHGARYRFGAALDLRWLAGGWSSHFESRREAFRLRTDFVTRLPRISPEALARMWQEAEATSTDVVGVEIGETPCPT
jgi:hypothetical protein